MLKLLLTQTSWSLLGTLFGFSVGFFVKIFLVRAIGAEAFGQYILGQTMVSTVQIFIALALPQVMLRFIPSLLQNSEKYKADVIASTCIKFLLFVSSVALCMVMIFSENIAALFNQGGSSLSYIIFASAIYIPLTLYMTALTTAYRTVLQVREIVLYGTLILVTIRAISTLIVFSFVNDVIYFIVIELMSLLFVLTIMTFKFDRSKLDIFSKFNFSAISSDKEIKSYSLKLYAYSLVGFGSGYSITIIMGVSLSSSNVGIYAILLTISGLSAFLLTSLNSIFAPVISKLHAAKDMLTLKQLFKSSTFIINIITTPFIVILVLFSKDILSLYGDEFPQYSMHLSILILGSYFNLFVGNTGMMLLMGGKEKIELWLKVISSFLIILFSILLIPVYGLFSAVCIQALGFAFINLNQVYQINKAFGFYPWDLTSFTLSIITIPVIIFFGILNPLENLEITDYFFISCGTVASYLFIYWNKIMANYAQIKNDSIK
jgi:O-antigen/teichoic acid export membrane protein